MYATPFGAEIPRGDLENLLLHLRLDPREHAVADDVVERAPRVVDVQDRRVLDPDVAQAQLADRCLCLVDLMT